MNRYVGVFAAAPALVQLETNVVRWFARIVGLPGDAPAASSTSGGSLANFSALVAARRERLPENFLKGVLYVSDQAHHCIRKAAAPRGLPRRERARDPVGRTFRIRLDAPRAGASPRTARTGLTPFLVVASAGTTNTGAVDDLDALADFAAREGLWLHVDAAYGGFFALTERGPRGARRPRARRLHRPRPAQGPLPAVRRRAASS